MKIKGWSAWWHKWRADVWVLACSALFFVAFFPRVIFGRHFIITGDSLFYSYPLRTVAWQMIRHGTPPVWIPYVLSGYPLLSMSQLALAYPLTWGYLFLPGPWAEQIYVLAPFLLAPVFTYAYAREIGRSRLAALLAGLAFGYGGMMCSLIADSGVLTNSLLWTPLVLLFIDRARTRCLSHCLLGAALAYGMSALAGHGQSYVYVGILAVSYGLFLSLSSIFAQHAARPDKRPWFAWTYWRPLLVALGALLLAAGLAAFQLLETLRAARRSVRSALSYEVFGEGSFTLREALLSVGAPLYHYVDTSSYLAPLALLLALTAVVCRWRGQAARDARLWFWLAVALAAFVLLLGTHTPLYRLVYYLPAINTFRVPSRHTFEWTFAVSILAAYGWDALASYLARRRTVSTTRRFDQFIVLALLALGVAIGALWWRATRKPPLPNPSTYTGLAESAYWLWKLAFTVAVLLAAWWCFRLTASRTRTLLMAVTILLACFAEPATTVSCWWARLLSLPVSRIQLVSPTTRFLQQLPADQNRVYTRAGPFAEEFNPHPRLEAPNLPALYGLHDLAGMEPLIFERYSRALGGVGPDSVTPRAGFAPNDDLFSTRSRVLDVLNASHVVSFTNLKPFEDALILKDGIGLAAADLSISLPPGASVQLPAFGADTNVVALVTSLANSVAVENDTPVARLRLRTAGGRMIEQDLRAGVDTAEWAHERPDVRPTIKHKLAPVFDSRPGDAANTFRSYRYWVRLTLDPPQQIDRVEITNVAPAATLAVWKVTLHDLTMGHSTALTQNPARVELDSARWQTVAEFAGVFVLRNTRALPRAWLVTEAEAVDGEEALKRIRGESSHEFDPHRIALLEVKPQELPVLPGVALAPESGTRLASYEPNHLRIETNSPTPTVLVVSEIFYPGWEATVDGRPVPILLTDYLLRGVALPAGQHRIEMRYIAPAARSGAIISGLTLLSLAGLAVYARRKRRPFDTPAKHQTQTQRAAD